MCWKRRPIIARWLVEEAGHRDERMEAEAEKARKWGQYAHGMVGAMGPELALTVLRAAWRRLRAGT